MSCLIELAHSAVVFARSAQSGVDHVIDHQPPHGNVARGTCLTGTLMPFFKPPSKWSANTVDWTDPDLKALLHRSESWTLDNRGTFSPQSVQIHIGWGAGGGRPAMLVWERDQALVLETDFPIPDNEPVRIDRLTPAGLRCLWGTVVEGREGFRAEDKANGIYVHWVHVR
ncbi:hypothetical protein [Dyella subtropica]|uniref:hypothetical protein n=1 Tax=Dyella subtropica TaxID=2992127 RepID=UPI0022597838|nr:hypothetical protein [Dyella subtropica]